MTRSIHYRVSNLSERVQKLSREGYKGFQITRREGAPGTGEQFVVEAANGRGFTIRSIGTTLEEAYENLIDRIDIQTDIPYII
ncbi:MAG: hypothetical protein ACNA78_00435 [Balneolaceae bacterium]